MDERDKLFKELIARKAGCYEMAWNGFVNLYTEDKSCDCKDCESERVLKEITDKIKREVYV